MSELRAICELLRELATKGCVSLREVERIKIFVCSDRDCAETIDVLIASLELAEELIVDRVRSEICAASDFTKKIAKDVCGLLPPSAESQSNGNG